MKAFMKRTLAIALLAGSTLSVVPAVVYAQESQSGTGAPILPRKGSSAQDSDAKAPQSGTAGQSQDMGATTQQPSASGNAGSQNAQSQAADPQVKPKGESAGQQKPADAQNAESSDPKKPRSDDTAQQKPAGQADQSGSSTAAGTQSDAAKTTDTAGQNNTEQKKDSNQAATSAPSNETTGSINVSTEQRTEIRSILVENKVEPVDIDIDVSVGVAVPTTVEFHPLPPRIIEIVPAYRGYEYFVLADGRIIIVEPRTHEVVYILAG